MPFTRNMRAIQSIFALSAMFGIGGGCVAIYGFDDFEKTPPISCKMASDCPGTNACGQPQCTNGICNLMNPVSAGALSINHKQGNCLRFICDGQGNEIIQLDESNVRPDGDDCTDDQCIDGLPINTIAKAGTPCGNQGALQCSDMGTCTGCLAKQDCGVDTQCIQWTCEDSVCVRNLQILSVELRNPVPGDCTTTICSAIGELADVFAADDAPSDEDPCTADYCTAEGKILHDSLPVGTVCGDCSTCAANGSCNPCDVATLDCDMGKCVPKAQACTKNEDCPSTYCVDEFCCDTECSSKCMACAFALTGKHSGVCAPVTDGPPPNNDCQSATDKCINGNCTCENGIQDQNEEGTDCGGANCNACTGTWNCGGLDACEGAVVPTCCWPVCLSCPDDRALCKSLHGKSCVKNSKDQNITIGTVTYNACAWPSNACRRVTCKCE